MAAQKKISDKFFIRMGYLSAKTNTEPDLSGPELTSAEIFIDRQHVHMKINLTFILLARSFAVQAETIDGPSLVYQASLTSRRGGFHFLRHL